MATLNEYRHAGEGIISEATGHRSRTKGITVLAGQKLNALHVVGAVTASGKFVEWNPTNTDGSEAVAGFMHGPVDATDGDATGVVMDGDCEVQRPALTLFDGATEANEDAAVAGLLALGIKAR